MDVRVIAGIVAAKTISHLTGITDTAIIEGVLSGMSPSSSRKKDEMISFDIEGAMISSIN